MIIMYNFMSLRFLIVDFLFLNTGYKEHFAVQTYSDKVYYADIIQRTAYEHRLPLVAVILAFRSAVSLDFKLAGVISPCVG